MLRNKKYWEAQLGESWALSLKAILRSSYMIKLMDFLDIEYAMNTVYPSKKEIFHCFMACPRDKVRIVILGDFPKEGANGLAYGDNSGSYFYNDAVGNIHSFIEREYYGGLNMNFDFSLNDWAKEGILLLNLSLTARKTSPHYKQWKRFIKVVIDEINTIPGTIIVLWGTKMQKLVSHFENHHHHIIYEEHPSYTERRNIVDWKTNTFTEINSILAKNNNETIVF